MFLNILLYSVVFIIHFNDCISFEISQSITPVTTNTSEQLASVTARNSSEQSSGLSYETATANIDIYQMSDKVQSDTKVLCTSPICKDILFYAKVVVYLSRFVFPVIVAIGTVGNVLTVAVLAQRNLPAHNFILIILAGKKKMVHNAEQMFEEQIFKNDNFLTLLLMFRSSII